MSYPVFKARHVMGSLTLLNTKDHEGKPLLEESKHHWFMGFAVPKAEWDPIWNHMYQTAANDPACTVALCGQPGFNWKIEDCDAPENPQNLGKPSYPAGHMLIKFTRYKVMGCVSLVDGNYQPIVNPASVKKGDYYYVAASTKFNGASTVKTNAGMYQNLEGLMFAASGEEIVGEGGFNAANAFAGVQGGQVAAGQQAQAQQAQATPSATPAATTPPAQQAPVTPAHDLVQPIMSEVVSQAVGGVPGVGLLTGMSQQTPGNATPPPVLDAPVATPPAEPSYNVQGTVYTKSQLLAMPGWTEAHLAGLTQV